MTPTSKPRARDARLRALRVAIVGLLLAVVPVAALATYTPEKHKRFVYRQAINKDCRDFVAARSKLPRWDPSDPQQAADHYEDTDALLFRLVQKMGSRKAPDKHTGKGVQKLIDLLKNISAEKEQIVAALREGDMQTAVAHMAAQHKLRTEADHLAKILSLKDCRADF